MDLYTIEKTPEDFAKETLIRMNNISSSGTSMFIQSFEDAYITFWKNNPQAVCNLMGNKAYTIFEKSAKIITFIISELKPDYVPPDVAKPYTIHENGAVTINEE